MIDDYLQWMAAHGRRPASVKTYATALGKVRSILGHIDPGRITVDDYIRLRTALPGKEQTVRYYMDVLAIYVKHYTGIDLRAEASLLWNRPRPKRTYVTWQEFGEIYRRADPTIRLAMVLGATAGLRRSEIARLRIEDVGIDSAHVIGKGHGGGKHAEQPLPREAVEAIRAYVGDRREGYVLDLRGKSREGNLAHRVRTLSDAVGIDFGLHTFRRLYATTLYEQGTDLLTIRDLMRHESVQTTQIYIRRDDERERSAVAGVASCFATNIYSRMYVQSTEESQTDIAGI